MKFKDLAWGSFVFANLTRGDPTYQNLVSDQEFLARLQKEPSLGDFQRLRQFLVDYGVHYAPKTLAQEYASIWSRLKPHIQRLRGEVLGRCDLNSTEIQHEIAAAYGCLQWPHVWGGDTVASKVLHFFNVSLFVMWDTDIQVSHQKFGAQGYVEFLQIMQDHAREVISDFEQFSLPGSIAQFLSQSLGYPNVRPLTKFLDDYNWVTITKDWSPTIPDWLLGLSA